MPRRTERPVAFLVEATNQPPCVMLDHAKAVEHAAWKHGSTEGLVRESLYIAAVDRIDELTATMQQLRAELEAARPVRFG